MPIITIDNEEIFYTHSASDGNDSFVLIHGSGGDHKHWPDKLRRFSGANIYAIDLPGHGQSKGTGRQSVEAYVDFINAFVQELKLTNVSLFGHSLGGAIAQMASLKRFDWLSKIVLVGTGARLRVTHEVLDGLFVDFKSTIEIICQYSFGPTADISLIKAARKGFLSTDPKITHADFNACDQFDIMAKINKITHPALVVSGTEDKLTPVKYGKYLKQHIPGAKILIIRDGGHMMTLEKTEEFMAGIKDFFKSKT